MRIGIPGIVVGAFAVSAAWAGLTHEPVRERQAYPLPAAEQQLAEARWDVEAERAFGLDRGFGARAMTEGEWRQHQQKMSTMRPAERVRYQQEVRTQIVERVKDKRA